MQENYLLVDRKHLLNKGVQSCIGNKIINQCVVD